MPIETGVLDTSFWTAGHRADVLPHLFAFFDVKVPPAVRDEVLTTDPLFPRRRYGHGELYRVLEGCGLLPVLEPSVAITRYGRGEAEALTLAEERGWWLLINDRRPLDLARTRGVRTLSTPGFILELYKADVVSLASTEQMFARITSITSPRLLEPAARELDRLARLRKERS